jgi:membrane protein YdbS with pleckstrin-like domain
MGFPAKMLNPGEQLAVNVRPHWKYLFLPILATVVALAGSIAALVANIPQWAEIIIGVVLVVCLVWLFGRYLRWTTTTFVVTTERLIMRKGILKRSGREILLDRLTDISYTQTFFDRILKCGDVLIESPGRDSPETFPDLPHPISIQNEIYRLIEQRRGGLGLSQGGAGGWAPGQVAPGAVPGAPLPGAPTGSGPTVPGPGAFAPAGAGPGGTYADATAADAPGITVADQLSQLDDLRKRGVISRKEFAAKKAELLSRM